MTTRNVILFGTAFVVTAVVYMPVCNFVFDCGCGWPGLGGVEHCNIHNAAPPHCPICEGGALVQALFFVPIFTPIFAALRLAARPLAR